MIIERQWFCNCSGTPRELVLVESAEDEAGEPTCPRCGASVTNDPKRTVTFRDLQKPGNLPAQ